MKVSALHPKARLVNRPRSRPVDERPGSGAWKTSTDAGVSEPKFDFRVTRRPQTEELRKSEKWRAPLYPQIVGLA